MNNLGPTFQTIMSTTTAPDLLGKNQKIYTGLAARILKFMSAGCTITQAASAVGCDQSYVSQLMLEDDFKEQIQKKIQDDFEQAIEIDKNYETAELEMTKRLKAQLPYVVSLDDTLRVLKIVNGAKRKSQTGLGQQTDTSQSLAPVRLMLPPVIIQNFQINPNSEVVSVDGRNLVTLNANSIDRLVAEKELNQIDPSLIQTQKVIPNVPKDPAPAKDKWGDL